MDIYSSALVLKSFSFIQEREKVIEQFSYAEYKGNVNNKSGQNFPELCSW